MEDKQKQTLVDAVRAGARADGDRKTISCAEAHRIADEHGAERRLVGEICNREGIRIVSCQLGLFR
jgi:hypothetical protein